MSAGQIADSAWRELVLPLVLSTVVLGGAGLAIMITRDQADATQRSLPPPVSTEADRVREEAALLKQIEVRNAQVGTTTLGEPGIFGDIKNTSAKTLQSVGITVYALDKAGVRIHEEQTWPVSDVARDDRSVPLKPGYARKFGVSMAGAPLEWAGQRFEVEVTSATVSPLD